MASDHQGADGDLISSLDSMFLALEGGGVHMHVPVLLVFESCDLLDERGRLDLARIRGAIAESVATAPHFLQRLARVPILGNPIWTDAEGFDLDDHLRLRRLDPPGDDDALKALVGRISGERLRRDRPLWEITIIEGLAEDRFALLFKIHHVMLDGRAGVEALAAFFGYAPATPRSGPRRPAESPLAASARLLRREVDHRVRAGRDLIAWIRRIGDTGGLEALGGLASGLVGMTRVALVSASTTPLNTPHLSPRRAVEWRVFPFAEVRARRRDGATINDVLLTMVSGMLRAHFIAHGLPLERLVVRATVPLSVERIDGRTNAVVGVIAPLPVAEAAPRERLRRMSAIMRALKGSRQGEAMDLIGRLADVVSYRLLADGLRLAIFRRPANVVVSNIVGPPMALSFLGARLLAIYPFVPPNDTQALALAFISYDGKIFAGFHADPEVVRDLPALADALVDALGELPPAPPSASVTSSGPRSAR